MDDISFFLQCKYDLRNIIESEEIKHDREMDKSDVWAGSGCMAVFPISRSRLISPPGMLMYQLSTDCKVRNLTVPAKTSWELLMLEVGGVCQDEYVAMHKEA